MNIPLTTFVLIDYGTPFKPDVAFVETEIGTTIESVTERLLAGEFEHMRGVYYATGGRFVDGTDELAKALCELPVDMLSGSAKEFVEYCGMDWRKQEYAAAAE